MNKIDLLQMILAVDNLEDKKFLAVLEVSLRTLIASPFGEMTSRQHKQLPAGHRWH